MSRHSKSVNAKPYFSHAERKKLTEYGTQSQRVTKDSFLEFGDCGLCLKQARNAVVTPHGYIYCKECILENILKQKKEIKKKQQQTELEKKHEELEKKLKEKEELEKKKKEFDKITNYTSQNETKESDRISSVSSSNFWIPSKTPQEDKTEKIKEKKEILDPSCSKPIKIKQLIEVEFQQVKADKEENSYKKKFECPCCRKTFEGGLKGSILKTCGHTICSSCFKKFTSKDLTCLVCSKKLKTSKDVIEVQANFTSFASSAGEKSEAKHWEPQIMYS
eukprot:gene4620-8193_t